MGLFIFKNGFLKNILFYPFKLFVCALMFFAFMSSSGCSSLSFLFQAGRGQMEIFNRSRPIETVLKDELVSPRTRELLSHVKEVKTFGEAFGLKATSNYREFVDLKRPAVVWVVSACQELQFQSKIWKFPIVGSFPYRGWFDLKSAEKEAQELREQGWDADVRGASAYSTLGWFNDPILSTMLSPGEQALGDLVDVILHESVHASIYIQDQSYFNESLASFVAEGLTPLFLEKLKGKGSIEQKAYLESLEQSKMRQKIFHQAYLDLDRLYQNAELSLDEKRNQKNELLEGLKSKLNIKKEINNATLIQFKTYRGGNEALQLAFQKCKSDWRRFLSSLSRIKREFFTSTQQEDLLPLFQSWECSI